MKQTMDYTFEVLPKPALVLRYIDRYGHPYKGPHNYIVVRRIRGRHSDYACKMITGIAHRGPESFNDVMDERDRLLRRVGARNGDKCYGLRLYGHGKCMKYGHEDITLDTPGVENLHCAWCGKKLLPGKEK